MGRFAVSGLVCELTEATARWEQMEPVYRHMQTAWYGMMCRSFLLLEKILQGSIEQYVLRLPELNATIRAANRGRTLERATFGQCFRVARAIAPDIASRFSKELKSDFEGVELLPPSDESIWHEAIERRNQLAHNGPGYLDSVDLDAGRGWPKYQLAEPLSEQSKRARDINRAILSSTFIKLSLCISGEDTKSLEAKLATIVVAYSVAQRELDHWELRAGELVNEFHKAAH